MGSEIVDTDGTVLAATDSVTLQQPTFDSPAEESPLLLGTGGYRPSNPDPVWTDESLAWAVPSDVSAPAAAFLSTHGLAYAITGSVALLRNNDTATESALDLDTGNTLWSRESGTFAEVGALDGDVATLFGPEVLRGIDVRTGSTVWDRCDVRRRGNRSAVVADVRSSRSRLDLHRLDLHQGTEHLGPTSEIAPPPSSTLPQPGPVLPTRNVLQRLDEGRHDLCPQLRRKSTRPTEIEQTRRRDGLRLRVPCLRPTPDTPMPPIGAPVVPHVGA